MALKRSRLTGLNTLAYVGVEPSSPPQFVSYRREPTSQDWESFHIGDLWLNELARNVWLLQTLLEGEASWINIGSSLSWISHFTTDSGSAYPIAKSINIFGDTVLTTTGSGNDVSVSLKPGTIGQFYLGGNPIPFIGNFTSDDSSIVITPSGHNIGIDATAPTLNRLIADDGFHADPISKYFTIAGDINISTTGGFVDANTLEIILNDDIVINGDLTVTTLGAGVVQTSAAGKFSSSKGTDGQLLIGSTGGMATWANITSTGGTVLITNGSNSINLEVAGLTSLTALSGNVGFAYYSIDGSAYISGSTNITTTGGTGSGDELTIDLNSSISLLGTITLSALGIGVLLSSSSGVFSSTNGTNGQLLIGRTTGGQPAWASVTSTGATIEITPGAGTLSLKKLGGNGTITQLQYDPGSVVSYGDPALRKLYMYSTGSNLDVTAAGDTITFSMKNNVQYPTFNIDVVPFGKGVITADATGLFGLTGLGTAGQLIIGGGSPSTFATVTSTDGSIEITGGAGSLSIDVVDVVATSYAFNYAQETTGSGAYLGGSGAYLLGQSVVLTKIFDDGDNVYVGDGAGASATFTAPVAGKYFLNLCVQFYSADNAEEYVSELFLRIITTARTYYHGLTQSVLVPMLECTRNFSTCADMDLGDVATFSMVANLLPGTGTITVKGGAIAAPVTWISGYLIMEN